MRSSSTTAAGAEAWDPDFATRSPWLVCAGLVAPELVGLADHPTVDALTAIAEERRRRFTPTLSPVRFVEQAPKPRRKPKGPVDADAQYDVRITKHGEIPSRTRNAHDFWNAIAWLLFPRSKRAIHARQCRALLEAIPEGARTLPNVRSRERDALTILDEGGALIVATTDAARAIASERFEATLAAALANGSARIVVLGHAVLDHLHRATPPVLALAHVLSIGDTIPADLIELFDAADRALAHDVGDSRLFLAPEGHGSVWLHASGEARPVARRPPPT